MTAAACDRHVRRLFAGSRSFVWRVGAEVELIILPRGARRPLPVEDGGTRVSLVGVLRELAAEQGWRESLAHCGVPRFVLPGIGALSFEPGGQLELSTRPFHSPSLLLATVRDVIAVLRGHLARSALDVLEIGLDPFNDVSAVPLAFPVERYTRMATYFASLGGDGARMMKQTASCQVSVDVSAEDAGGLWHTLNAVAPFCVAAFANSPQAGGRLTGDLSTRARVWQHTDPARTGIFAGTDDPAADYRDFALRAPAFLLDVSAAPLRQLFSRRSVSAADRQRHLSTLFPEVRPRGYLEFRACDMVGDDARSALLVLLCAMARDREARSAVREITGAPNPAFYAAAPAAPAALLSGAAEALAVALRSARREPVGFWRQEDLARAERFLEDYAERGLTPAADWRAPLLLTA